MDTFFESVQGTSMYRRTFSNNTSRHSTLPESTPKHGLDLPLTMFKLGDL